MWNFSSSIYVWPFASKNLCNSFLWRATCIELSHRRRSWTRKEIFSMVNCSKVFHEFRTVPPIFSWFVTCVVEFFLKVLSFQLVWWQKDVLRTELWLAKKRNSSTRHARKELTRSGFRLLFIACLARKKSLYCVPKGGTRSLSIFMEARKDFEHRKSWWSHCNMMKVRFSKLSTEIFHLTVNHLTVKKKKFVRMWKQKNFT